MDSHVPPPQATQKSSDCHPTGLLETQVSTKCSAGAETSAQEAGCSLPGLTCREKSSHSRPRAGMWGFHRFGIKSSECELWEDLWGGPILTPEACECVLL